MLLDLSSPRSPVLLYDHQPPVDLELERFFFQKHYIKFFQLTE